MSARIYEHISRHYCWLLVFNASSQQISLVVKCVSGGLTIAIQIWSIIVWFKHVLFIEDQTCTQESVSIQELSKGRGTRTAEVRPEMKDFREKARQEICPSY